MNTNPNHQAYESLCTAGLLPRAVYGQLRLTGVDRADFLQRMTTNNITVLQPGQAALTVLTSSTARILFVFSVLCRNEDLLLLPAGPDQAAGLARHLRGQIFFMDQVAVHDEPARARLRVVGSEAPARLVAWRAPVAELVDHEFMAHEDVIVLRQDRFDLPGYEILVPLDDLETHLHDLQAAGFVVVEDAAAYTTRRVELGQPAAHAELVEEYTPLEVGLAWTCSENKGCYTGQEIIARQITYDKVTRGLVGLTTPGPVVAGAPVMVEGRNVGTVTSAAYSPALQSHVALAVVRRTYNEPGQVVQVRSKADGSAEGGLEGKIAALPLQSSPTSVTTEGN